LLPRYKVLTSLALKGQRMALFNTRACCPATRIILGINSLTAKRKTPRPNTMMQQYHNVKQAFPLDMANLMLTSLI
ncbi:hypothetical protein J8657_08535, partial [Dickeya oryzae]|nr:hypothetical protein [Dickeya oryzae]